MAFPYSLTHVFFHFESFTNNAKYFFKSMLVEPTSELEKIHKKVIGVILDIM